MKRLYRVETTLQLNVINVVTCRRHTKTSATSGSGGVNSNSTTVFSEFNGRLPNATFNNHITHDPSMYYRDKDLAHLEPQLRKQFQDWKNGKSPNEGGNSSSSSSHSAGKDQSNRGGSNQKQQQHHQHGSGSRNIPKGHNPTLTGGKKRMTGPDGKIVRDLDINDFETFSSRCHLSNIK